MGEGPRWLNAQEQVAWRAYLRSSRMLWVALDKDLQQAFGVSLAEYEILSMISEQPQRRMRMSALATLVVQSRSRLTHTAKRLENRRLVERRPVIDDRRGVELVLLDSGFELLERASSLHVAGVRENLVDLLDDGDFEAVGRASLAVMEHLGSRGATLEAPTSDPLG
ncbi:MarR family winged helix-turn-helix transcriptional regulator [Dermacoccaceae bacterium W4C1]